MHLLTYLINKLRRLKIDVLKGENSLSAEMEIEFNEFLLSGGMKQAMSNTTRRSVGGVTVCSRRIERFLNCHSSLFSTTVTVSSADLTD